MKTQDTIRLQDNAGQWRAFNCTVIPETAPAEIHVPALNGQWLISKEGMIANIGGNDWRIYTLHPEDCERICNVAFPMQSHCPVGA